VVLDKALPTNRPSTAILDYQRRQAETEPFWPSPFTASPVHNLPLSSSTAAPIVDEDERISVLLADQQHTAASAMLVYGDSGGKGYDIDGDVVDEQQQPIELENIPILQDLPISLVNQCLYKVVL
jgi:hypothetical protein